MPTLIDRQVAVLDWLDGHLVHARGGRRANYRPLSATYPSLDGLSPFELVSELHQRWGVHQFYLADLNLLQGGHDTGAAELARAILDQGFTLWFDRGDMTNAAVTNATMTNPAIRGQASHAQELRPSLGPNFRPILGTESCSSPRELFQRLSSDRWRPVTVSLDLWRVGETWLWFGHPGAELDSAEARGGSRPVSRYEQRPNSWREWTCLELVAELSTRHVEEVLLLNLADVGAEKTTTGPLLAAVRQNFPALRILAGGGVRNLSAMTDLVAAGADRVLVGSWLWAQLAAIMRG
ncbi:MAG: hypothetical protein JNL67_00050 [Planctomycetaceae bacterium]|nr:hypothetical protein [Planctomycetaceae bacterium]